MTKFNILTADLKYIMNALRPAIGKTYAREAQKYIKFECTDGKTVHTYSSDGYRLHSISTKVDVEGNKKFSFLIKPFIVPKVESEFIPCEISEKEITFDFGNYKITFPLTESPDNFLDVKECIPKGNPKLKIGFNPKYLEQAAKSLKQGGTRDCAIMEIRGPLDPVIIYLSKNKSDFRLVLPVRTKSEEA